MVVCFIAQLRMSEMRNQRDTRHNRTIWNKHTYSWLIEIRALQQNGTLSFPSRTSPLGLDPCDRRQSPSFVDAQKPIPTNADAFGDQMHDVTNPIVSLCTSGNPPILTFFAEMTLLSSPSTSPSSGSLIFPSLPSPTLTAHGNTIRPFPTTFTCTGTRNGETPSDRQRRAAAPRSHRGSVICAIPLSLAISENTSDGAHFARSRAFSCTSTKGLWYACTSASIPAGVSGKS